jgi:hypothetical protein
MGIHEKGYNRRSIEQNGIEHKRAGQNRTESNKI